MANSKKTHFDYGLALLFCILTIIGILALTSASSVTAQEKFNNSAYYLLHQLFLGIIPGIILAIIFSRVDLAIIKKLSWLFVLATLFLMGLVFIPALGVSAWGATRWLNFGFFTFQPAEFLKLTFIIYLSAWLARKSEKAKKDRKSTFFAFLAILGLITALLIFQSDLSTLAVIMAVAFLIYFLARTPLWHSLFFGVLGGISGVLLVIFEPYRFKRVLVFFNSSHDPMGIGYQVKQGLISIGSGGIFGVGLGMSTQKFGFVPQAMADSVFTIFAEEAGLLGSLFLILVFIVIAWKCVSIYKRTQDKFCQLFVVGFASWICIQAFVNIAAMLGLLPLAGIPLPFLSYGGSHLVSELAGAGLLLNISKSAEKW